ncbi:B12-binding domain-containing radical SAM protein [Desulfonema magnum]|nr:radical SAM protein [Desulfonema magnum]
MKILLLNPPNIEENKVDAHTIPLGILYLNEFIKQKGYDCDVLNLFFKKSWQDVSDVLSKTDFQVVGISCYTRQRFSVFKLAEVCKKMNTHSTVVLGGPHATFLDKQILEEIDAVDYIIRKEGELTFLELLIALEKGRDTDLSKIRGLTFRENGSIIKNPPRKNIENLSDFPPPAYTQEHLASFPKCEPLTFRFSKTGNQKSIAPILASRGCNNNCLFCSSGLYFKKQIYYTPEYVFNQILELNRKLNVRMFDFYDDNFTHSKRHVHAICDLIIKSRLDIIWWCSCRAESLDEDLLLKMKAAGCFTISYGMESGSQRILNNIRKNLTIEDYISAAELTKKTGLYLRLTISIGHPGENEDSINETIKLLGQIKPDQVGLFLLKLYPGTPLHGRAKRSGFINNEYWFDKRMTSAPFYTENISLEKLIEYKNMIKESLKPHTAHQYENIEAYNLEFDLEW